MKCNSKECIPVSKLGWEEDVVCSIFVCLRVIVGVAWNDGHVSGQLKTLNRLHHTS